MNDIVAFYDTTCPDCGRRYGWHGRMADKPPCPGCRKVRKEPSEPSEQAPGTTCSMCRHCSHIKEAQYRCSCGGFAVKATTRACGDYKGHRA